MVTSLQDSRRSKLYRAERTLEHELRREQHPLTTSLAHDQVQPLVDRAAAAMGLARTPRVEKHRAGTTSATAWSAQALIKLPINREGEWNAWGRQPIVVLHEVAHCMVNYRLPGHGREFVAAMKRVLAWFMEEEHGRAEDPALARFAELLTACKCHDQVTARERSQIRFQLRHASYVGIMLEDGTTHTFVRGATGHAYDEENGVVVIERGRPGQSNRPDAIVIALDEIRYAVSQRASAS